MSKFKVGDRVQFPGEPDYQDLGTVTRIASDFGEDYVFVDWDGETDDGASWPMDCLDLAHLTEAELRDLFTEEEAESPLMEWEQRLLGSVHLDPVPDPIHHPAHYAHPSRIEVIDITRHESFLRGNVIKYVLRAPYKGCELEDLKKAQVYLAWEVERLENAA